MINLQELYELQNDLDKFIVAKTTDGKYYINIYHNDKKFFLSDRILALFTEVGEFANATKCFKYWSKKPSESKERLLDEYVDMLHFWLSIGNTMKFTPEEVQEAYLKKNKENMERQLNGY